MIVSSSTLFSVFLALSVGVVQSEDEPVTYGVDVSYPMHYSEASKNFAWLPWNTDPSIPTPPEYEGMVVQPLGDKQTFYEDLIQGCVEFYGKKGDRCLGTEKDRIAMNLRQPKGMYNYTKLGYTKIRAPDHVFSLIKEFWEKNKTSPLIPRPFAYVQGREKLEIWGAGNTYTNHWDAPTYMLSVDNTELDGGGYVLKQHIWNAARDTISEWTGQQLAECSLYGIRIYKDGAVLAPHVDRLPLVSSAIINVDQDVDEPWPLEVIGHDGIAVNITMKPGDLVLYESHAIIHGRQFPLKGRSMANIFIHFEPIGAVGDPIYIDPDLPGYIQRGSEEEANWRSRNPDGYHLVEGKFTTGSTSAHNAAGLGDSAEVKRILKETPEWVNHRDVNGWMPLHEAVRGGHLDTVEVLLEHGADINARTKNKGRGADGGSALWWAVHKHGEDHPLVVFMKEKGAKLFAPGEGSHESNHEL